MQNNSKARCTRVKNTFYLVRVPFFLARLASNFEVTRGLLGIDFEVITVIGCHRRHRTWQPMCESVDVGHDHGYLCKDKLRITRFRVYYISREDGPSVEQSLAMTISRSYNKDSATRLP
ncbi:hypothetical protein AVEN_235249-1 [Araneus ventricosus]|uniref:Uncharacterized protein n=1 Tax=Araneus ventricosus TaxID=182803 RepID=A0A4Y2A4S5_ARAVE|nr:hypothetical protein AVEN_235249-1 [Araneus ventricosus]